MFDLAVNTAGLLVELERFMRCIDGDGDRANGGGCCLEVGLVVLLDIDEAHVCYTVAARLNTRTTFLVLNNLSILMNNF